MADDTSERKRISIPRADDSALAWWATQNDPSLSVRLLIRNEIERSGYTDVAFRPVAQLPRRGRPPGTGSEAAEDQTDAEGTQGEETEAASASVTPIASRTPAHAASLDAAQVAEPVQADGFDAIDDLMNG